MSIGENIFILILSVIILVHKRSKCESVVRENVLPLDRMIRKAYELIRKGRIEQIGDGVYNVIGEHGTYTVVRNIDGSVACNCPGFMSRKRCSHSLAVLMLNQPVLLKSIKMEIEKAEKRAGKH